jgi:hypothetical protein
LSVSLADRVIIVVPLSLVCRARRLNVLIQPNLKFMFELQGWEGASLMLALRALHRKPADRYISSAPVELSREKAELEHGVRMTRKANGEAVPEGPRQHGTKALSWPIMAKEMVRRSCWRWESLVGR